MDSYYEYLEGLKKAAGKGTVEVDIQREGFDYVRGNLHQVTLSGCVIVSKTDSLEKPFLHVFVAYRDIRGVRHFTGQI